MNLIQFPQNRIKEQSNFPIALAIWMLMLFMIIVILCTISYRAGSSHEYRCISAGGIIIKGMDGDPICVDSASYPIK